MKKYIIIIIILLSVFSCKEKPTFCEEPYTVNQIKLVPTKHWTVAKEVTIKNDSLINFIMQQICEIKDVSWSTDTRGDSEIIEIQLIPNLIDKKIYVVKIGYNYDGYRIREGTTYFKNDILCELIAQLTELNGAPLPRE